MNSDLNNYTTPGTYVSISGEYSTTLLNCPYKTGNFKLFVIQNTGNDKYKWLTQTLVTTNSQIFHRALDGYDSANSTNIWKKWVDITRDYIDKESSTSGYIVFTNGLTIQWSEVKSFDAEPINLAGINIQLGKKYTLSLTYNSWEHYIPFVTRRGGGDNSPGLTPSNATWTNAYVIINFLNVNSNAIVFTIGFIS